MKSSHGTFAAIVWIVAGALLYNSEPEARLISWQTPVYFLIGMFVAAALFGNLSYATVRGVTHALVSTKIVTAPDPARGDRSHGDWIYSLRAGGRVDLRDRALDGALDVRAIAYSAAGGYSAAAA